MIEAIVGLHHRISRSGPKTAGEKLFFLLLVPLSGVYSTVVWIRNLLYDAGLFKVYRSPVPVISVGNLIAGGTGKTPVVDWLIKVLLKEGIKVAVVSRGYGGNYQGRVGVVSKGQGLLLTAQETGDEPCLLARRNRDALVIVARKKSEGVDYATSVLGAQVVVLDDAFQHRAVYRGFNLVLLDAAKPFGNGWLLPAGMLRELPSALSRADAILMTRGENTSFSYRQLPVFSCRHRISTEAISLDGEVRSLSSMTGMTLCAFAGIASPESFFTGLEQAGLVLNSQVSLLDHCDYRSEVRARIVAAAQGCDALVTTEKDAVKLTPEMFPLPCYRIPMDVEINHEEALKRIVLEKLEIIPDEFEP